MGGKFVVNRKAYDSIDDIPAAMQSVYQSMSGLLADADHNSIPDILECKGNPVSVALSNLAVNIIHDGKVYSGPSDLPPELREKYEKAMQRLAGAQVPSAAAIAGGPGANGNIITASGPAQVFHDGKVYTNPNDLPPEIREKYEQAVTLLGDANQNGIPDILAGVAATQKASTASQLIDTLTTPSAAKPADDSSRKLMIAAGLMVVLAVVSVLLGLMILNPNK
jgi:O-acetyl-ADP-ribose deacetylase (regulator of RNase III)